MPELQPFPLVTRSGKTGRVFRASRFLDRSNVNRVEFDDGTSTTVLASELHVNPDGTFVLDDEPPPPKQAAPVEPPQAQRSGGFRESVAHGAERPARTEPPPQTEFRPEATRVTPPAPADEEENLAMETAPPEAVRERQPDAGAAANSERIERAPSDRHLVLDEPVFAEDVDVERVPVNRIVDQRPETRQEGDTTVIPVVEEVITIQKRLLVREEVRITRRRVEVREPRRVMLDGQGTQVIGSDGRNIDLK